MAKHDRAARDRRADAEELAAGIFAAAVAKGDRGKTTDHLAREALEAARVFYRACDESPAGLGTPAKPD